MPLCTLKTNLPKDKIPADFLQAFTKVVAESLGKPEQRVNVIVETDCCISKGGSTDPAIFIEFTAVDVFSKEKNPSYSPSILSYLEQAFPDIKPGRTVLLYKPINVWDVGINSPKGVIRRGQQQITNYTNSPKRKKESPPAAEQNRKKIKN